MNFVMGCKSKKGGEKNEKKYFWRCFAQEWAFFIPSATALSKPKSSLKPTLEPAQALKKRKEEKDV